MAKAEILTILKDGVNTRVDIIDYSTPDQQEKLKAMKRESEQSLGNKIINPHRLSKMIIKI